MPENYKRERPCQKLVRFSYEELEFVKRKIQASPFSDFQNFARVAIISSEIKVVDYSQLAGLNRQIQRIGNNINQVAKIANQSEAISSEELATLITQLDEVKKLMIGTLQSEIRKGSAR